MPRTASVQLSDREDSFLSEQVESGRYQSERDVVGAALRLLEDHEARLDSLREALLAGVNSGPAVEFDMENWLDEQDGLDAAA